MSPNDDQFKRSREWTQLVKHLNILNMIIRQLSFALFASSFEIILFSDTQNRQTNSDIHQRWRRTLHENDQQNKRNSTSQPEIDARATRSSVHRWNRISSFFPADRWLKEDLVTLSLLDRLLAYTTWKPCRESDYHEHVDQRIIEIKEIEHYVRLLIDKDYRVNFLIKSALQRCFQPKSKRLLSNQNRTTKEVEWFELHGWITCGSESIEYHCFALILL